MQKKEEEKTKASTKALSADENINTILNKKRARTEKKLKNMKTIFIQLNISLKLKFLIKKN